MFTRLQAATALNIAAVAITGLLAYSVRHGLVSSFIARPEPSVRIALIPIPSTTPPAGQAVCCPGADRP